MLPFLSVFRTFVVINRTSASLPPADRKRFAALSLEDLERAAKHARQLVVLGVGDAALAFSLEQELSLRTPVKAASSSASEEVLLPGLARAVTPAVPAAGFQPEEVDWAAGKSDAESVPSLDGRDLEAVSAEALVLQATVEAAEAAAEAEATNYGSSPSPAWDYDASRGSVPNATPGQSASAWLSASSVTARVDEGDEAAEEAGGAAGTAGFQPGRAYVAFAEAVGFEPLAAAPHGRGGDGWSLLHCMCARQDMASVEVLDDLVVDMPEVSEQHASLAHVNSLVRLFVSIVCITNLSMYVCCLLVGVLRPNPSLIRASSNR